ncbi:MAG: FHA domain-containing protein [Planctomycetota bacterium]
MQVVLKVVGGKNDGREISITVPRFIIGRGDTAHLRPSSDLVSREHCEIRIESDGVVVNDLNSRNGTFVNGRQLEGTHVAKSGDSLRVGRLQFEIVMDPSRAGNKRPKVQGVIEAASRTAASTAKKKQSLEDSITDWLMDDDVEPNSDERRRIAGNETIQLNLEDSSVFGGKRRERMKEEAAAAAAAAEEEESKSGKKKKGPGKLKLPTNMKSKHEDSTSAADDVLRKFFNRR